MQTFFVLGFRVFEHSNPTSPKDTTILGIRLNITMKIQYAIKVINNQTLKHLHESNTFDW